jgi:hypothetical protein
MTEFTPLLQPSALIVLIEEQYGTSALTGSSRLRYWSRQECVTIKIWAFVYNIDIAGIISFLARDFSSGIIKTGLRKCLLFSGCFGCYETLREQKKGLCEFE